MALKGVVSWQGKGSRQNSSDAAAGSGNAAVKGINLEEACRNQGFSTHSYYRWRKEYGGLKIDQVKRLKELEEENSRLKKLVADLSLDNSILKEVSRGNF